jgi:hypothetical protein
MATSAVRAPTMVGTTGSTWAATANAVDGAVGVNNATYATWTNAVSSGVGTIELGGFGFAAIVGASDTLTSVSVSLRHLVSNTGRVTSVTIQAFDGTTAIGTAQAATLTTAAHNDAVTVTPTLAQLRSANFKIRVTATHAANTQSLIWSVDYVDVTVDYTPPPTSLTLSPATLTLEPVALTVTLGATADPAALAVVPTGPTTATLTWDAAVLAGVTDYSVFRRTPSTGVPFDPTVDTPVASAVALLTYPATGLTPATEYEWQVFGRVPEPGGFTPPDLPDLEGWYDASDLATITASAGLVSQWNDKSGNGRHMIQPTGSRQPTTGAVTQNGLNTLSAWNLKSLYATLAALGGNTGTFWAVFKGAESNYGWILGSPSWSGLLNIPTGYWGVYDTSLRAFARDASGAFHMLMTARDGDATYAWKDGLNDVASVNSPGSGSGTGAFTFTQFEVGRTDPPFGLYDPTVICEVGWHSSVLSSGDRVLLEDYLSPKWASP